MKITSSLDDEPVASWVIYEEYMWCDNEHQVVIKLKKTATSSNDYHDNWNNKTNTKREKKKKRKKENENHHASDHPNVMKLC